MVRMKMELIHARPPMYDEIADAFDVRGKPILFAWGNVIYAPQTSDISVPLLRHEEAHGKRQLQFEKISGWWTRYINDPDFRLEEEKIGHIAEYLALLRNYSARNDRRRVLSFVAGKLASNLYRYSITKDEARRVLEDGHRRFEAGLC